VLHTFVVKRFAHWAHHYPSGSRAENILHFLAETEVVFGLWAAAVFVGIAALVGSASEAVHNIEGLNFTEPRFVLMVMVVAATRPVVKLAEVLIARVASWPPLPEGIAFYTASLTVGSLLGRRITKPAAMTLLAILLKRRYFDRGGDGRRAHRDRQRSQPGGRRHPAKLPGVPVRRHQPPGPLARGAAAHCRGNPLLLGALNSGSGTSSATL
jgi:hypothetical protein